MTATRTYLNDNDEIVPAPSAADYEPLADADAYSEHAYYRYLADFDEERRAAWIAYGETEADWYDDFEGWSDGYGEPESIEDFLDGERDEAYLARHGMAGG